MGIGIVILVIAATALAVAFATRGAMAGNREIVEVLHFVGATDSYIARQFQKHFLSLGLRGGGIGGALSVGLRLGLRRAAHAGLARGGWNTADVSMDEEHGLRVARPCGPDRRRRLLRVRGQP